MEEFFVTRLQFYTKRKNYLSSKIERDLVYLENKLRFIIAVIEEKIILRNRPKKEVLKKLVQMGFIMEKDLPKIKSTKVQIQESDLVVKKNDDEEEQETEPELPTQVEEVNLDNNLRQYNYLTNMPLMSITLEEVEKIRK